GLPIPLDATIISFPGKVSKLKGIDLLLQANSHLPKNKNVHFIIFGSGNVDSVLTEKDKETCSFDNVHFLGHQPQEILGQVFNISKFCLLPSRSEGFGIAILEAMACGLPVIATNVEGISEFAVGELVPPNSKAIAGAILNCLNLS